MEEAGRMYQDGGMTREASLGRHHGGGIMEEAFGRGHQELHRGENIIGEASWRRYHNVRRKKEASGRRHH